MRKRLLWFVAGWAYSMAPGAEVTFERILHANREPQNWLTYSGSYNSQRYSLLDQITVENATRLEVKWVAQMASLDKFEATPLVVDGVLYTVQPPNDIVAMDGRTGRVFWTFAYQNASDANPCCGRVNRGVAILGGRLFMGTIDAHLVAVDARTGKLLWKTQVADHRKGYALALAPLVVKDKVIVGTAGGELGIRGYLAAYDAATGKEAWRFYTVPGPGEPGHETWGGDSWKHGGASIWLTGSYDPELNLTYWGVGNPGPDWNADVRPGDNLYSDSVVALDPGSGKLRWYFQFTPHDEWDFDSVQIPVLADLPVAGKMRKLMLWANRNAFYYVLDRTSGEFLHGSAFAKQTWAKGLDSKGRPILALGRGPSAEGTLTFPGVQGGTNWYSPSFSPRTGLFYLTVWEDYSSVYYKFKAEYEQGKWYVGGSPQSIVPATRRLAVKTHGREGGWGAIRALEPLSGKMVWEHRMDDVSDSGLLTTAGGLLFSGNREGYFMALDAKTGKVLWSRYLGGQVIAGPMTYAVDGSQYVAIAAGNALFTFGLRKE